MITRGIDLKEEGRSREALDALGRAIEVYEALLKRSPTQHRYRVSLGLALAHSADLLFDLGKPEDALHPLQRSRDLIRSAVEKGPRNPWYLGCLSGSCKDLAEVLLAIGEYAEAIRVAEELAPIVPDGEHAAQAAGLLIRCAVLAREDDRFPPAERAASADSYAGRARTLIVEAERLGAEDPGAQDALASVLAESPDAAFRDPARALELIEHVYANRPKDQRYWGLCGVAEYRAGNMSGAIAAMKQRMEQTSGGSGPDWFYLAMALWREGDRGQARAWFQKAASWTDRKRPKDPELRRLRAEAAGLIGFPAWPFVGGEPDGRN